MKFTLFQNRMEVREIRDSGLFDTEFYIKQCPGEPLARKNPIRHYLDKGWKEKKNPSRYFDTTFYLRMNPDVRQAGINPLVHYVRHGQTEGRSPRPGDIPQHANRFLRENPTDKFLRLVFEVGKWLSWRIPSKYRQKAILRVKAWLGLIFGRQLSRLALSGNADDPSVRSLDQDTLVRLDLVEPAHDAGGSIGIHIHLYYKDLGKEFAQYLRNMPFPYDLYLSIAEQDTPQDYRKIFSDLPNCRRIEILSVPNRGRDIAPFFCTFGDALSRHDFIAHFHSKKSAYNQGATAGWRKYLCTALMGSPDSIRRIFTLLQGPIFGIVYPQNFSLLPYWANTWLANQIMGAEWCNRLGIKDIPGGYFNYPASSMFWARRDALASLFNAGLTLESFPEECGQTDGTLAHCMERLFGLTSHKLGRLPAIIADEGQPSWSPWRFDQYLNRSPGEYLNQISAPNIKVIAFDIFDTIFCRPLLNPETIKQLVARRLPEMTGRLYLQSRGLAEAAARKEKGMDVSLTEIYRKLGELSGFSQAALKNIQSLEVGIEEACLTLRPGMREWIRAAAQTGKPLVLISDMFLPEKVLLRWLKKHDLAEWDGVFISGDVGTRKETGDLYRHVLDRFAIQPEELLMIGDNERSDVQVPCDQGTPFLHVMKSLELARGTPRISGLVSAHERRQDLDAELTLGLVLRKNFGAVHPDEYHPANLVKVDPYNWGYSLVGPLLTSFCEWLLMQARKDRVTHFHFLAREGKLIQRVYDAWSRGRDGAPDSGYLVLSRRAAGVSAITSSEDIAQIARTVYYPNTLGAFLHTRYGIVLTAERWQEIQQALGLTAESEVSISEGDIRLIRPLLKILESEILAQAKAEKAALRGYLKQTGMLDGGKQAIVDIGYGGSVQAYLNRLIRNKLHGYYMMTEERAKDVTNRYGVLVRGCFHEDLSRNTAPPILYRHSFELEKLLSSDDPQVEHYALDGKGNPRPRYRSMTPEEIACGDIRKPLQDGVMDFVQDALQVRAAIKPDFQPSCWSAEQLLAAFLRQHSTREKQLLSSIILDDHYCGRGLVS